MKREIFPLLRSLNSSVFPFVSRLIGDLKTSRRICSKCWRIVSPQRWRLLVWLRHIRDVNDAISSSKFTSLDHDRQSRGEKISQKVYICCVKLVTANVRASGKPKLVAINFQFTVCFWRPMVNDGRLIVSEPPRTEKIGRKWRKNNCTAEKSSSLVTFELTSEKLMDEIELLKFISVRHCWPQFTNLSSSLQENYMLTENWLSFSCTSSRRLAKFCCVNNFPFQL